MSSTTDDADADWETPAFAARETFLGIDNASADAALVVAGVPLDIATTNRAGAREGPAAIRRASRMVGGSYPDLWPDTYDADIADVGNFRLLMGDVQRSLALIQRQASRFGHLICMGGDHLISLPLLRAAAARHGPLGLVHFDAHVDTWEQTYGSRLTHGTMFRVAIEEGLVDPRRMVQVGIRCRVEPEVWAWTLDQGVTIVTAEEVHLSSPAAVAQGIHAVVGEGKTYLSFDIDGLDPSCAPGTGTPEVGGLMTWQARGILTRLRDVDFVGMDLVEVSPPFDVGETTALAGASMICFYIGLLLQRGLGRAGGVC
jgi:agmatinase